MEIFIRRDLRSNHTVFIGEKGSLLYIWKYR